MAKNIKTLPRPVSRRDFLALASSTLALAVAACPACYAFGAELPSEVERLASGGITRENFENARKRAAAIVARMTLDEKISQFNAQAPAVSRIDLPAFNNYASEALHGLIHGGPVTSFPVPLALGCSWNRSLVHRVFTAVSDEVWAWHKKGGQGLALFSPPTVNMGTRDPRWGRIAENYSEDPYLVGQMAIYTTWGMQGKDPRYLKTIACAKHFICNDTDDDRETASATVDPRSFWEYYSRGFEAAVKEGQVFTVMSSYNAMNGIPTTASRFLLTDLLERWGFRGYVVSDCDAIGDIFRTHHFVPTYAQAAALAVSAGCDINCGDTLRQHLREAVDQMLIGESAIDRSLIRSITGRVLLGMFDPPEQNPYSKIAISCLEGPAHLELAREAARQSIVLFKNDNHALPLDKSRLKRIAVIGPMADVCNLGNYSGTPQLRVSPLRGIQAHLGIQSDSPSYEKRAADFFRTGPGSGEAQWFNSPHVESCNEGGEDVGYITDGSWAVYSRVLFSGATEFHARVASGEAGGTIEVHLDSITGPLVSKLKVPKTGGWQNWVDVSAPLSPVSGEHTALLRFVGGGGTLFNIQAFHLTPQKSVPSPVSGAAELTYALGCTVVGEKDPARFAEAVKTAREADVALVFVGTNEEVAREGQDRVGLGLPGVQHDLVQAVYAANPRTILVISSNAPVAVNWEQDHLPAIIGGLFLGEQQGHALADVLFGDYNPGGRASTTWYRRAEDLPDFHDYNIRHGRTYMYFHGSPLYPFGHGLSYTTFEYRNLRVSDKTLAPGSRVTVLFDVSNSGNQDGDEIVQLYVHCAGSKVERPVKQLLNFDRMHIKAGETRTARFEMAHEDRAFRYWDEDRYEFVTEPGTVDLMVGGSSAYIRLKEQIQLLTYGHKGSPKVNTDTAQRLEHAPYA